MLWKLNPSFSIEGIALLPTHTALVYQDNITKVSAISAAAARVYNLTVGDVLEKDLRDMILDCTVKACTGVMEHDAWKSGEAAGFEMVARRADSRWYNCAGLIVGNSDLVFWNACLSSRPYDALSDKVQWRVLTFDELVV